MRVVSLVFVGLFCSLFLQAQSMNGDWEAWSDPSTWASGRIPIDGESIRIPAGKQILLDVPSPALGELQIEGHLQVAFQEGLSLSVGRMDIEDGGRLSIGTEEKAFTNSFDLIVRDVKEAGIRVAKGGSLSLYAQKTMASASSEEWLIQLWLQTAAQLRVETGAAEVVLFGVGIQGEAPFGQAPFFLDWEGPLSSGKYLVAHCQFSNLSGGAIQLDKTDGLPILDNVFYQIEGPAIQCSPSGLGKGNRLEGNLIVACQPAHLGAIQLYHPGQIIKHNKVLNIRGSAAVRFDLPPEYEGFDWTEQGRRLEFAFNDLRNEVYGPIPVTGLFVADFPHTNLWTMNDNQVEGFGLGIDCLGHRLIFENTSVRNCLKGILPGGASFRNGEIVFAKTSP
ncbi:MAG: G8 domain-containing protein, partial [Bacteroidota bacterium]